MLAQENTMCHWKPQRVDSTGALHYARSGRDRGEPLLPSHGIGGSLRLWAPAQPRLTPYHDVIALDLPGRGGMST